MQYYNTYSQEIKNPRDGSKLFDVYVDEGSNDPENPRQAMAYIQIPEGRKGLADSVLGSRGQNIAIPMELYQMLNRKDI